MSRNPYWIRLRGTNYRAKDDWNEGRRFGGADFYKGVEALIASNYGAIVVRMKGERGQFGEEHVRLTISSIPWADRQRTVHGVEATIYSGYIDEIPPDQPDLFQSQDVIGDRKGSGDE